MDNILSFRNLYYKWWKNLDKFIFSLIILLFLFSITACVDEKTNPYARLDISYEKGRLYTYADCLWKEWAFENDDKKYTLDELYDIWAKFVEPEVAPIHRERKIFFLNLDKDKQMIFIEIDKEMKKEIDCFNFLDL